MHIEKNLLDQILRCKVVFPSYLAAEERDVTAVALERLVRDRVVSPWVHRSGLRYWTRPATQPLSDVSLVRSLGVLLFCRQSHTRSLVTRNELESCFPTLFRHGLPAGHYVDQQGDTPRLGNVRVDSGRTKIARILSRTTRLIQNYRNQTHFRDLIDSGHFELTWIVPTAQKQRRLSDALRPLRGSGIDLKVGTIPELLNVIAPIQAN